MPRESGLFLTINTNLTRQDISPAYFSAVIDNLCRARTMEIFLTLRKPGSEVPYRRGKTAPVRCKAGIEEGPVKKCVHAHIIVIGSSEDAFIFADCAAIKMHVDALLSCSCYVQARKYSVPLAAEKYISKNPIAL